MAMIFGFDILIISSEAQVKWIFNLFQDTSFLFKVTNDNK